MSITLLSNANVYAPEFLGLRNIVLAGGKIVYIGKKLPQLDGVLEAQVIDLDGRAVVPGFIDSHTHITGGGGEAGLQSNPATECETGGTLWGVQQD